ncbi:MAG: hypothetical protein US52_C0012G0003 [candidate division WS6 bacterium GW2011_GWA2_37_6]|uniref:Uncharacterized protein n=1 Tax=candidate division WS6 bacterium GW2011_GWA2_37_6 TaxID=1619087 RepID=A0A0G0GYB1_9BACT|nr:MAG: hypothetical protein US52_C0012G0003 [candidate division WS6 bacterium GW2011_GWA2_37_6]
MLTFEELRSFRLFGFTVFDTALAFVGIYFAALLLSKLFKKIGIFIPRRSWLLWTLPIGTLVHKIIGQSTPMTDELFDPSGYYLIKIFIIALVILGFIGMKRGKK